MAPLILWAGAALAHPVSTWVLGPDDDWCAFIDEAQAGGDLVLLEPGDYTGPCTIEGKPTVEPEETTLIQSLDTAQPARFVHDGAADHVLRLTGEHVGLYHLAFEGIPAGVAAVRVEGDTRLWSRFLSFRDVDGVGVEALRGDDVRVQDSWFEDVRGAPVVFGCPDGSCPVSGLLLDGNVFVGVSGAVVHPGAAGVARDNLADGLLAPAIRWAGGPGTVEGNLLVGTDVLQITAPGVLVRNNVLVGAASLGASEVLGNTLLGPIARDGGARFEGNAVLGPLPAAGAGNVSCADRSCWLDADGWDFRPVVGGPLDGAGVALEDVPVDFCGTARGLRPDAGAVEHTVGAAPLILAPKRHQDCAGVAPAAPEDTGAVEDPPRDGCGCSGDTGAAGLLVIALGASARPRGRSGRRRRRGDAGDGAAGPR